MLWLIPSLPLRWGAAVFSNSSNSGISDNSSNSSLLGGSPILLCVDAIVLKACCVGSIHIIR